MNASNLDNYLTKLCMEYRIGDVVLLREQAPNTAVFFCCNLIFQSVFEKDIGMINQIAKRVDGAVPDQDERYMFANLLGDAIDDVMMNPPGERNWVHPEDLTIIALAKVVIWIACSAAGGAVNKRKDREKAIELVLERTGGRKSKPTSEQIKLEYVEPDWMKPLPSSEEGVQ